MKKTVFYSEWAYVVGVLMLAFATALMERGGFGMSIAVAPAYVVYLKLSEIWSFFSFGLAEYLLQGLVLTLTLILVGRVRISWVLSFGTTILYGLALDGFMAITAGIPSILWLQIVLYVLGFFLCVTAVGFMLHSYLPPSAYDLYTKLMTAKTGRSLSVIKTTYDVVSLAVAVLLSLLFFGEVRGVDIGTVGGALLGGVCIRWVMVLQDRLFDFRDRFAGRPFFE